jgi:hypothetical protein
MPRRRLSQSCACPRAQIAAACCRHREIPAGRAGQIADAVEASRGVARARRSDRRPPKADFVPYFVSTSAVLAVENGPVDQINSGAAIVRCRNSRDSALSGGWEPAHPRASLTSAMEYATRIALGVISDAKRRRRVWRTGLVAVSALAVALACFAIGGGFASSGPVGATGSAQATHARPARPHGACLAPRGTGSGSGYELIPNAPLIPKGFAHLTCVPRSPGTGVQRNR